MKAENALKLRQSGADVTAANETYNGTLSTGGSVSFGFQGSYSGSNAVPATFTLDGAGPGRIPPDTFSTDPCLHRGGSSRSWRHSSDWAA